MLNFLFMCLYVCVCVCVSLSLSVTSPFTPSRHPPVDKTAADLNQDSIWTGSTICVRRYYWTWGS
jgi:hypothetical protein